MICPHCGMSLDTLNVSGAPDPTPLYLNLNNAGCHPLPGWTTVCAPQPLPNAMQTLYLTFNAAGGCANAYPTFIQFL